MSHLSYANERPPLLPQGPKIPCVLRIVNEQWCKKKLMQKLENSSDSPSSVVLHLTVTRTSHKPIERR